LPDCELREVLIQSIDELRNVKIVAKQKEFDLMQSNDKFFALLNSIKTQNVQVSEADMQGHRLHPVFFKGPLDFDFGEVDDSKLVLM